MLPRGAGPNHYGLFNFCQSLAFAIFKICTCFPSCFSVWAQLLDRSQQRLVLVVIPLSLFIPTQSENSMEYDGMDFSETIKILIDETSDVWINVCC